MRQLAYSIPDARGGPSILLLMRSDGEVIKRYESHGSYRTIEHNGVVWRLNGQDRATGEYIYLAEVILV